MEMFHIQFECRPSPKSEDYEDTGGAYVNCWIQAEDIESAKAIAVDTITENKWDIVCLEESFPVELDDYEDDEDAVKYHKQAELSGEVYVYHMWPNEPQPGDVVH